MTQTLIDDGNGKSIYVPLPRSTSSVAAPAPMPTLVYNCEQMPLIYENIAAWWLKQDPNSNGNVSDKHFIFYFDPDQTNKKNATREHVIVLHRTLSGTSNGKIRGFAITAIATDTVETAITLHTILQSLRSS